jgi:hypothetical protein
MPPPAATHPCLSVVQRELQVAAGSRSLSVPWRRAVHKRAFTTVKKTLLTTENRIHVDINFLDHKDLRNHFLQ